jgi:hypothetical protein
VGLLALYTKTLFKFLEQAAVHGTNGLGIVLGHGEEIEELLQSFVMFRVVDSPIEE